MSEKTKAEQLREKLFMAKFPRLNASPASKEWTCRGKVPCIER